MDLSRHGRIGGPITAQGVNGFLFEARIKGKGNPLPSPTNKVRETQPLATVHISL